MYTIFYKKCFHAPINNEDSMVRFRVAGLVFFLLILRALGKNE